MNPEQLLIKAKTHLTMKHPYFGMLASRLRHEPGEGVSGYASNGVRFLYNPAYIEKRTIEEVMFILTNCVMHHVLSHQQRRLNRRGSLWQLATDYAINNLLHQNGLVIPQGANFNTEFKGMYAEEIYDLLKEQYGLSLSEDAFGHDDQRSPDTMAMGDVPEEEGGEPFSANDGTIDEGLDPQSESQWQYAASVAKEVAQRKGSMPTGMDRLGKRAIASGVDWRFELYNAINRHMRNNYAFMPPNKKHIYRGIALPSLASDTLSLCVAIDTSGSINDELLGLFMEEFKSIMNNFPAVKIELITADAKVHNHYTFQGGERLDFSLKGGGGTDFRPVFDYIDANLPMTTMLLYFTDGEGRFPRIPPAYEVLWALSGPAKTPFGRALALFA
ncbi:VWA-like domain-containing protein [Sulfuricurvum sp.]|uniref:vWA domain-containing protein n=1 Tax=Sulfuricurvum sp. TaxID=2025608 RepID=UPI0026119301|nr:VWA-like domain-containing protein [Sulfuricurvum sp.]MDD4884791.1 VWA-like domain-containing protein [Sulfuricurvum sp.]